MASASLGRGPMGDSNPYMEGVKTFLLLFFGAVVLFVPMTLGAIAFVLSLLGFDLDNISDTVFIVLWIGGSLGFALWGVNDMGKKEGTK